MIKIEHIAFWVYDLERSKSFYVKYFNAHVGNLYENPRKNFRSYFLSFENGCRMELMQNTARVNEGTTKNIYESHQFHIAFSLGSKEKVNQMTELLRNDGFTIYGEPRTTGDGYYESIVLDPENNHIELTV